jgi:hypothetical protein
MNTREKGFDPGGFFCCDLAALAQPYLKCAVALALESCTEFLFLCCNWCGREAEHIRRMLKRYICVVTVGRCSYPSDVGDVVRVPGVSGSGKERRLQAFALQLRLADILPCEPWGSAKGLHSSLLFWVGLGFRI